MSESLSKPINVNGYLSNRIDQQLSAESRIAEAESRSASRIKDQAMPKIKPLGQYLLTNYHDDHQHYLVAQKIIRSKRSALSQISVIESMFNASRRSLRHRIKSSLSAEQNWSDACQDQVSKDKVMLQNYHQMLNDTMAQSADRLKASKNLMQSINQIRK